MAKPDGVFPSNGHIFLLYLAAKLNTECVWNVEAEAEHQGEQSNILFLHFFGTSSWVAIAPGLLSVGTVGIVLRRCYKLCITALQQNAAVLN